MECKTERMFVTRKFQTKGDVEEGEEEKRKKEGDGGKKVLESEVE